MYVSYVAISHTIWGMPLQPLKFWFTCWMYWLQLMYSFLLWSGLVSTKLSRKNGYLKTSIKNLFTSYFYFFFRNIQTYVIRLAIPDSCSDKVSMQMSLSSLPPTREVATLHPDCYRPHKKTYLLFAILQIDLQSTLNKLALESVNNILSFCTFQLGNHACTCFRRPFKYLSTFSNNPTKYKSMSFHVL